MTTTTAKVNAKNASGQTIAKKSSGWTSAGSAYAWAKKEAAKLVKSGCIEIEISWF